MSKIPYCGGCEARRETNDNGDCPDCGTLIQFVRLDATHNGDLHELIEEWKDKPHDYADCAEARGRIESMIDELGGLIEDE